MYGILYVGSVLAFYVAAARMLRGWSEREGDAAAIALDLLLLYAASMLLGAMLVYAVVNETSSPGVKGGAGVFVAAFALYLARNKQRRAAATDAAAVALPFGLTVAKLACATEGCCYGTPTNLPWAVEAAHGHGYGALHPTQLYDAALLTTATVVAYIWVRRRPATGEGILVSILAICLGRFATEFVRGDHEPMFSTGLTGDQWVSLAVTLLSGAGLFHRRGRAAWRSFIAAEVAGPATTESKPRSVIWVGIVLVTNVITMFLLGVVGLLRIVWAPPAMSVWPKPPYLWRWYALSVLVVCVGAALALRAGTAPSLALGGIAAGGLLILAVLLLAPKRTRSADWISIPLAPEPIEDARVDDERPALSTEPRRRPREGMERRTRQRNRG